MAGRGGLNLTHSEPIEPFMDRYGAARARLQPCIDAFPPAALTAWAEALGQPVFTGTSGRVFPRAMKASPLLRAWLARLADQGVEIRTRQDWRGWDEQGRLIIAGPEGERAEAPDAVVLALGGASWPRLGSTGDWAGWLTARGVPVAPFRPANSGFLVDWSATFVERFAGQPLKGAAFTFDGRTVRGEAMIAAYGLEGGAVYALSASLRDAIARDGHAVLAHRPETGPDPHGPDRPTGAPARVAVPVQPPAQGRRPVARRHRPAARIRRGPAQPAEDPAALAARIKAVPLTLTGVQGLDRAISSAGGIAWEAVDDRLMLTALPGVFVAGEMLDWEAPTGGYLLQASFASGATAGRGAADWLARRPVGA